MKKEFIKVNCQKTHCRHYMTPCCQIPTEIVYKDGDKVDIIFVGMGAGKTEEAKGRPFVGKAGKYLRDIIAYLWETTGVSFNIALSNTVRCHPKNSLGKDREPTNEELINCLHHLYEDCSFINPHVIVTCGKSSTHSLITRPADEGIGKVRGKKFYTNLTASNYWPAIPTYHPSFLARNYGKFFPLSFNSYDYKTISDILTALKLAGKEVPNVSTLEKTIEQMHRS